MGPPLPCVHTSRLRKEPLPLSLAGLSHSMPRTCRAAIGSPVPAERTSSAPCAGLHIAPLSDPDDPSCMQGTHQPPLPPSSAALVHRQAISLPPASPQAQLPEQLQLQLLPSADERQTLAMPFGGHGRPTTPELSAAMGQLTSLVAWDQVLSLSGNPLEGLVQMVNNYAQVRRATLCRQGLLAIGQQMVQYAGQPDAVRLRYLQSSMLCWLIARELQGLCKGCLGQVCRGLARRFPSAKASPSSVVPMVACACVCVADVWLLVGCLLVDCRRELPVRGRERGVCR